jgi:hypothetical protein
MLKFLPDGTKIEITSSDTYSGPNGKPGCLRTSKNADWYRINDGEWQIAPQRTTHKLLEWIEMCENLHDFVNYPE